jgi:hypothetical protein
MPCDCAQCRQHWATLGIEGSLVSRRTLHVAFRAAARLCHPDRFENDPASRLEAEERFKRLQVAYRELNEHLPPGDDNIEPGVEPSPPGVAFVEAVPVEPAISFGDAPGCYVAPDLPPRADRIARDHLSPGSYPVAIVDLTDDSSFSRFFLLATHGAIVKDVLGITSLIWYEDLGGVELFSRFPENGRGLRHRLLKMFSLPGRTEVLNIHRRNGKRFCSLTNEMDDNVKVVLYRYLLRKKFHTEQ